MLSTSFSALPPATPALPPTPDLAGTPLPSGWPPHGPYPRPAAATQSPMAPRRLVAAEQGDPAAGGVGAAPSPPAQERRWCGDGFYTQREFADYFADDEAAACAWAKAATPAECFADGSAAGRSSRYADRSAG